VGYAYEKNKILRGKTIQMNNLGGNLYPLAGICQQIVCIRTRYLATISTYQIPSDKLVYIPSSWEEPILTSWYTIQLSRRDSSLQAGINTSLSEGIPSNELDCVPACRERFLPVVWPLLL
jgi:hypothetical protein